MQTLATPAIAGTAQKMNWPLFWSPVTERSATLSSDGRGERDPPGLEREASRHDEQHVEAATRARRARVAGILRHDVGLEEERERHVDEADVQAGEVRRPRGATGPEEHGG